MELLELFLADALACDGWYPFDNIAM